MQVRDLDITAARGLGFRGAAVCSLERKFSFWGVSKKDPKNGIRSIYRNAERLSLVLLSLVSTERRTSVSPSDSSNRRDSPGNRSIKAIFYGVIGGALCILFLVIVAGYCLRRNRERRIKNNDGKYTSL